MRTRTSFQKRQKEIARAEKHRDNQAKRFQKKFQTKQDGHGESDGGESGAEGEPEAADMGSEG